MSSKVEVVKYGKGFAIFGNTKPYTEVLRGKGFKYNPNLNREEGKEPGWIVSPAQEPSAREFVREVNSGKLKGKEVSASKWERQMSPVKTTPVKQNAKATNMYSELSSYTDVYVANKLALSGEDVTDSALVNRYNLHVSMLSDAPNDANWGPAFDNVFRSKAYNEVSDLGEIEVGKELGSHKIAILPHSTLFDGHMCLTALRMALKSDPSTAYSIQIVNYYDSDIAADIQALVPKQAVTKKLSKTSAAKTVPVKKEEVSEEEPVEETKSVEEKKPKSRMRSASKTVLVKKEEVPEGEPVEETPEGEPVEETKSVEEKKPKSRMRSAGRRTKEKSKQKADSDDE